MIFLRLLAGTSLAFATPVSVVAQVHHFPDGNPWNQRADSGPDAVVEGWFYQLGVTGIRVRLSDEHPKHLVVGHVFKDSAADGAVEVGDHIVGAGGRAFDTPHRNGYGMEVFGPDGPILDFSVALESALSSKNRRLELNLLRGDTELDTKLSLRKAAGPHPVFSRTFPDDCPRTDWLLPQLLDLIAEEQREDGSFGHAVHNTFAPLALMSGGRKYRDEVKRSVRFHAKNTYPGDDVSLVNWRYTAAAIVMSEYYLLTKEAWVLPELQEVYEFLHKTQYVSLDQVLDAVKESHPDSYPKGPEQQHGGWGHNPGFEGYGPIAMLTGQGALAFAMMRECGIEVDEKRHRAAYAFLDRGTGENGYLWYGDDAASETDWADMGRTGASALAYALSPFREHEASSMAQVTLIGEQPHSFPDTHASPLMGMGYVAAAASLHAPSFRQLYDANRWWFILADCGDGTFHYQPNRDNSGYGADSRLAATAVTAFILSLGADSPLRMCRPSK